MHQCVARIHLATRHDAKRIVLLPQEPSVHRVMSHDATRKVYRLFASLTRSDRVPFTSFPYDP
jgi:hypothetical protein